MAMKTDEITLFQGIFSERLPELLGRWGVPAEHITWVSAVAGLVAVSAVLLLATYVLARVFTAALRRFARKTVNRFDDQLVAHHLPQYLGRIIPLTTAYNLAPVVLAAFPRLVKPVEHLVIIFFIVLAVRIAMALFHAGKDTLELQVKYRGKPLGSYLQVVNLILYIFGGLAIFSQLTGFSIGNFLVSMGAASAVLLLIFKDTILGFVASIQVSANDMVRVGDWIEMPKYNADGDVEEINLTTVKVRNSDKSVTMVPTYALVSDSVKNWRGMQESKGRRIKRSIRIKVSSIRFLNEQELDHLRTIELLRGHLDERRDEIRSYNASRGVNKESLINGRNLTNVGLFRRYMELYALDHPGINKDLNRVVRQLPPDERGLPLELYCFSSDTSWIPYEHLIADIFDHLLAAAPSFGLAIFESPASDDLRNLARELPIRTA
ncbi:MAG: mechanosensitive ion channel [Bacteroidetes bacterium]|nr:mechanosensitive ion channel [Bacteroidota bacterium]MBS1945268.1 mechanosensitive ion channel [Bacteroidota bacterium]